MTLIYFSLFRIPRNMDVREFITSAGNIFLTTLQVNTSHLEQMTLGKWDMCRMYGRTSDIKLGFRIMCSDTFLSASSIKNSTVNVRNIATLGHSRIVTDIEWSFTS